MNDVLFDYLDHFAVIYLDDILIFSPTYEEHIIHIKKVLDRLRTNSLLNFRLAFINILINIFN